MIDYEKLKTCHELVEKIRLGKFHMTFSEHDGDEYRFYAPLCDNFYTNSLDELLEHLRELSEPEPKYKVGDKVWMVYCDEPKAFTISNVVNAKYYLDDYPVGMVYESELFPTRQALIQHQLQYWAKLMQEECTHPNKYLQQDGKFDCDDCGMVGIAMGQPFEGEIKGFGYDGYQITPYIQSNQPQVDVDGCQHGLIVAECNLCRPSPFVAELGRPMAEEEINLFKKPSKIIPCSEPDIQSNQPQINVDRCQHESDGKAYTVSGLSEADISKCVKCGEFYR